MPCCPEEPPELAAPDAETLRAIARRIEALPCNRPGTDKRWGLEAMARALAFRRAQRSARRLPNGDGS